MPLPRTIIAAALSLAAVTGQAAEFEGSVPLDLLRYFAGGGEASGGLPADFPAFSLPEGVRLMGSFARSNEEKVLMRTTLGGEEAEQAVAEALLAEGWQRQEPEPSRRPDVGFVVPESATARQPTRLCHGEFGRVEVRGEDGAENRVYLRRYDFLPGLDGRGCGGPGRDTPITPVPSAADFPAWVFLPDLRREDGGPLVTMALGGPGEMEETVLRPAEGRTPREIKDYYAAQLREQGWRLDAEWAGDAGAGSTWTRSPPEEILVGGDDYVKRLREQGWRLEAQADDEAGRGSLWTLHPPEGLRIFFRLAILALAPDDYEVTASIRALD